MAKHFTFLDFSGILVFEKFLEGAIHHLLVQSQQWKHWNNVPNMFKVNNKETKTTLMTSFWCLYCCYLWTYSTHCFGVSIVDFEQVNARLCVSWYLWQNLRITNFWCISESLVVINCNKYVENVAIVITIKDEMIKLQYVL